MKKLLQWSRWIWRFDLCLADRRSIRRGHSEAKAHPATEGSDGGDKRTRLYNASVDYAPMPNLKSVFSFWDDKRPILRNANFVPSIWLVYQCLYSVTTRKSLYAATSRSLWEIFLQSWNKRLAYLETESVVKYDWIN